MSPDPRAAPLMSAEEFDRSYPAPDHWRGLPDQDEPEAAGPLFIATVGSLDRG